MVNENEKSLISTRQKTTKVSFIKTDTLYIGGNQYKGIRFNGTDFIIFFLHTTYTIRNARGKCFVESFSF